MINVIGIVCCVWIASMTFGLWLIAKLEGELKINDLVFAFFFGPLCVMAVVLNHFNCTIWKRVKK